MGFLEFGAVQGLAYRNNYEADMDRALQMKQMQRQAKIDAVNKAALLDYKPGTAADPYNSKMLNELVKKNATELGRISTENPNWDSDPQLRMQILALKNEMLDNPYTKASLSMAQHKKDLDDFAAKTPGALQLPEIQQMYKDYDYAAKNGTTPSGKAFTFMNPLDTFDIDLDLSAHAKTLGTTERWDQSINGGMGATVTAVDNGAVIGQANNIWSTSPNRLKYQAHWAQMDEGTKSYYNNDPIAWLSNAIKAKTDYKIDPGKFPGMGRSGSGATGPVYLPFNEQITKSPREFIDYNRDIATLAPTYKKGEKNFINPTEPIKILMSDVDGKKTWLPLDSYINTEIEVHPTQKFMNDNDGRTMIEYSARLPLKTELISKGLLKDNNYFFDPEDYDSGAYANTESTTPVMRIELNGDVPGYDGDDREGKTGRAIVKFWAPAATSTSHIDAFNDAQLGLKEKNEARPAQLQADQINKMRGSLEGKKVEVDGKIYLIKNGVPILQ